MYKFQKDDLIICKPAEQERDDSNKDFEIYARVAEVDRDRDAVRLDCYQKQGRLHLESRMKKELSLSEMERNEFYQPLNDDEVLDFRDGLCDLLTNKMNYLYSVDVQATFDLANEMAEEIERERKSGRDIEI
jgi:hypothetical protein